MLKTVLYFTIHFEYLELSAGIEPIPSLYYYTLSAGIGSIPALYVSIHGLVI